MDRLSGRVPDEYRLKFASGRSSYFCESSFEKIRCLLVGMSRYCEYRQALREWESEGENIDEHEECSELTSRPSRLWEPICLLLRAPY